MDVASSSNAPLPTGTSIALYRWSRTDHPSPSRSAQRTVTYNQHWSMMPPVAQGVELRSQPRRLRSPSITAGNALFIHSQKYVADVTRLDLHIEIITVRRQTQR